MDSSMFEHKLMRYNNKNKSIEIKKVNFNEDNVSEELNFSNISHPKTNIKNSIEHYSKYRRLLTMRHH